jgi:adenylate cyclase
MMTEQESRLETLWKEIKRRKVVRVVAAYLLVGWGLIQIADATIEPLRLPEWADTLVVWLVAMGFPVAVILAWVLDVTPSGIKVTDSIKDEAAEDNAETPAPSSNASIAVLPFVNMSGDPDNEYFSDGLSEELLNLLARLQSLRVCSRTTSFTLKGKDIDMSTIANQLGVRHVLEGSVRRSGNHVRITAQLIDAVEDRHLWSETYDRELEDIFAVQDEIAGNIFAALKLTLTAGERQAIQPTTHNVEALDCYLRGRELYHRTETGHLQKSREKFEEAIRIDPDYALAWAGLTYVFVDTYWYKDKEPGWIERAHEASRKAVELAPHLAESHGARGLAFRVAEQFDEAEAEFEEAIAINPRLFEPLHFYAGLARSLGQYERAAELFCRAAEVRPEDYQALALASNMYEAIGDMQRARDISRETVERAKRAIELNPNDSRALVLGAGAWQTLGEVEKALEWAGRANEVDPRAMGVMYNTACIYAKMGDPDRALDLLEKAAESGARNKRYWETDSDFDSIREHPRFKALLERI